MSGIKNAHIKTENELVQSGNGNVFFQRKSVLRPGTDDAASYDLMI